MEGFSWIKVIIFLARNKSCMARDTYNTPLLRKTVNIQEHSLCTYQTVLNTFQILLLENIYLLGFRP